MTGSLRISANMFAALTSITIRLNSGALSCLRATTRDGSTAWASTFSPTIRTTIPMSSQIKRGNGWIRSKMQGERPRICRLLAKKDLQTSIFIHQSKISKNSPSATGSEKFQFCPGPAGRIWWRWCSSSSSQTMRAIHHPPFARSLKAL